MTSKQSLRAAIRESRAQEPADVAAHRAQELRQAADDLAAACGRAVAAFQPTNHEPDIGALLADLDLPVYLPRTAPGRQLEWVLAAAPDLAGGRQGIPVPTGPAVAAGGAVAGLGVGAILVPALAVDPDNGARLGYGAGYYDRLLAKLPRRVLVIGVCRQVDLLAVPRESHDAAMDAVLTESGLRRIRSGGGDTGHAPTA